MTDIRFTTATVDEAWPHPPLAVAKPDGPTGIAKIAGAISAVMSEIGVVGKDGRHVFHQYAYAKMEDILQRLTPLMAKHGLVVFQTELDRSMVDEDRAVAVRYAFTICHSSGEVWPDRPIQTGLSRCRDSKGGFDDKSFNKAHTAARKYFLLALFQIPTGDEDDADKGGNEAPVKTLSKKDAKHVYTKLQAEIDGHTVYAELLQWGRDAKERIELMPEDWQDELRKRFAEKKVDLRMHPKPAPEKPMPLREALVKSVERAVPDAATEPEEFLKWSDMMMAAADSQEALDICFNAGIEPHAEGMFPPDKACLVEMFERHQRRLAK